MRGGIALWYDGDMKELERALKALANKRRLAIVKYLRQVRTATVTDIAGEIDLSFKSTSRHLTVLRSADIVESEQRGPQVFYRLAPHQRPVVRFVLSILWTITSNKNLQCG